MLLGLTNLPGSI